MGNGCKYIVVLMQYICCYVLVLKKFIQMKREEIIKELAKIMLKSSGLSQSIIAGYTSKGREITQLEHKELDLGLISNYRLRKLYDEYKNS